MSVASVGRSDRRRAAEQPPESLGVDYDALPGLPASFAKEAAGYALESRVPVLLWATLQAAKSAHPSAFDKLLPALFAARRRTLACRGPRETLGRI